MKIQDVLVIDDDIVTLNYVRKIITNTAFKNEVHTFSNGRIALEYLDTKNKDLEQTLVFLDINMPVLNGWGFLDELQKKSYQNKLNVLIISTSNANSDKEKSNKYPQVIGYLEKPIQHAMIINIINLFMTNIIVPGWKGKQEDALTDQGYQ